MLGDVKSFFTKSTVGEVAVGLSVGAAFTNVMSAVTEMGRNLIHGQFDYGDVVQSLIALLAAIFFSLILVVKPLAKLKAMADRSQVALVADATQQDTDVVGPLAEEGADDGLVAGTSADPTVGEPAVDDGELVVSGGLEGEPAPVVDPTVGAASIPAEGEGAAVGGAEEGAVRAGDTAAAASGARYAWSSAADDGGRLDRALDLAAAADGDTGADTMVGAGGGGSGSLERGTTVDAADAGSGGSGSLEGGTTVDAVGVNSGGSGSLEGGTTVDAVGSGMGAAGAPATVAAGAAAPIAAVAPASSTGSEPTDGPAAPAAARAAGIRPHSHTATKVCPYCAFDIPAVASRCGWCTADVTDAQRTAGVVLVEPS